MRAWFLRHSRDERDRSLVGRGGGGLAAALLAPALGCVQPVDIEQAPASPLNVCQEAYICSENCVEEIGGQWVQDEDCVRRCLTTNDTVASPCGGSRPADIGANGAWGCEGATIPEPGISLGAADQVFVAGLCDRAMIAVCECEFTYYDCAPASCVLPAEPPEDFRDPNAPR